MRARQGLTAEHPAGPIGSGKRQHQAPELKQQGIQKILAMRQDAFPVGAVSACVEGAFARGACGIRLHARGNQMHGAERCRIERTALHFLELFRFSGLLIQANDIVFFPIRIGAVIKAIRSDYRAHGPRFLPPAGQPFDMFQVFRQSADSRLAIEIAEPSGMIVLPVAT